MHFWIDTDALARNRETIARLSPLNPFCDPRYMAWREAQGYRAILIGLARNSEIVTGCPAFISSRYLINRTLEVTTIPILPEWDVFWNGLLQLCRSKWISYLVVQNDFGSVEELPRLDDASLAESRTEFRVDTLSEDLWGPLDHGHKYSIKRARRTGVRLRDSIPEGAFREHAALFGSSLERRASRGERILTPKDEKYYRSVVESGLGRLFQSELEGRMVASQIFLVGSTGAYYFSSGASPEGMKCGAAAFTIYEALTTFKAQGIGVVNLGHGVEHEGLSKFKAGFGAAAVPAPRVEYFVAGKARKAIARLRKRMSDPSASVPNTGG
jgi:Acetyltransferase (GNAT) domain